MKLAVQRRQRFNTYVTLTNYLLILWPAVHAAPFKQNLVTTSSVLLSINFNQELKAFLSRLHLSGRDILNTFSSLVSFYLFYTPNIFCKGECPEREEIVSLGANSLLLKWTPFSIKGGKFLPLQVYSFPSACLNIFLPPC